jgi:hypothetical protein
LASCLGNVDITSSVGKVRSCSVQHHFFSNPELDLGFGSASLPELEPGPSVQVQTGSVRVQARFKLRTEPQNTPNAGKRHKKHVFNDI